MAKIPTATRQFYDTTRKASTLQIAADTGLEIMQGTTNKSAGQGGSGSLGGIGGMIDDQQKIKMDSMQSQAMYDMQKATQEWRLKNQSNPNSEEARAELGMVYDGILQANRDNLSPEYRNKWDIQSNKIKSQYDIQNMSWGFAQNQKNVESDINKSIASNYNLARAYGQQGDFGTALAEYQSSSEKLLDYGAKNLGTQVAADLLNEYDEQFAENYLLGMSEVNPQGALDELKNNPNVAKMLGYKRSEIAEGIIDKQIKLRDFQQKKNEYAQEVDLSYRIDDMNPVDGLKELEKAKGNVSSKYYNAKERALMSSAGITAETRSEEYAKFLLDSAAINPDDARDFFDKSNNLLASIEESYADGKLKLSDKRNLINALSKRQGKALPDLIKEESGWYKGYDYNDVYEEFSTGLGSQSDINDAMLRYDRTIAKGDYSNEDKKSLVNAIKNEYKQTELNRAINGQTQEPQMIGGFKVRIK